MTEGFTQSDRNLRFSFSGQPAKQDPLRQGPSWSTSKNPKHQCDTHSQLQDSQQNTIGFHTNPKTIFHGPSHSLLQADQDNIDTIRQPIKKKTMAQKTRDEKSANPVVPDPLNIIQKIQNTNDASPKLQQPKSTAKLHQSKQLPAQNKQQSNPKVPSKADEIMAKEPLRVRLAGILPPSLGLAIGYRHQKLLDTMVRLDRTIDFMRKFRNKKIVLFKTIKQSMADAMKHNLCIEDLQRIVYLTPSLYVFGWVKSEEKPNDYDMTININSAGTEDVRKAQLRSSIVKLIWDIHEEFLSKKFLYWDNANPRSWHPDFDVNSIILPLGQLPPNPNQRFRRIKDMSSEAIASIENPQVRDCLNKQKSDVQDEIKSFVSNSASVLLNKSKNGTTTEQFTKKLYELVRQKQQKLKQQKEQQQKLKQEERRKSGWDISFEGVDLDSAANVARELCQIYVMKGISNMFAVTVYECLTKRFGLTMNRREMEKYVELLTKHPIGYLTEVKHPKGLILKIEKEKCKTIVELLQKR